MAEVPEPLTQLLDALREDGTTVVPDEVTLHALRQSGVDCKDVRTARLVSLAAQRFLAAVLDEAANTAKRRRLAPAAHLRAEGHDAKDPRLVLATEDLADALKEYGVNASTAPYYANGVAKPQ